VVTAFDTRNRGLGKRETITSEAPVMYTPMQISFRDRDRSDTLEAKVRERAVSEIRMPLRHALVTTGFSGIYAVALILLSACTLTDERKELIGWTHARITENFEKYNVIRRDKALAGCINWENSTPENIDIRHLNASSTAESSVSVFIGQLMNSAIAACNRVRETRGSNCTCVSIDTMGKPVLEVPDSFIEKLQAADVLAMEGEHLQAQRIAQDGLAAYERGDYDQAIQDYDEAIHLNPDYALAFNRRGIAYWHKGNYDRAIQDYDEAIRLKPDYAESAELDDQAKEGNAEAASELAMVRPPVKSWQEVEAYLDQNNKEIEDRLSAYNRKHRVLVGNNFRLGVKRIHSMEIQRLNGESVFVQVSFEVGRRGTPWTAGEGTFLFELEWARGELEFVGHQTID
jgi:tetratricopeptide (TPR) repeat protein